MNAAEQLTRALVDLATKGQRPRCGDPATHDYWTSDDQAEREQAASWCAGCPILRECAATAESESFGVWGAVDVTPPTTRQKRVQALKAAGVTPRSNDPETSTNTTPNRRRTFMTLSSYEHDRAVLEVNARSHRHDPILERACELWDTDRAAFDRLPQSVKSQADIYRDLRQYHRDAVAAGVYLPNHDPNNPQPKENTDA